METLTITNQYLVFGNNEVTDAIITFTFDDNEIEVSEIEGDFDGITEDEAIEYLNTDSSQIFNECHLEHATYQEDYSAYSHHKD